MIFHIVSVKLNDCHCVCVGVHAARPSHMRAGQRQGTQTARVSDTSSLGTNAHKGVQFQRVVACVPLALAHRIERLHRRLLLAIATNAVATNAVRPMRGAKEVPKGIVARVEERARGRLAGAG